MEDIFPVGTAIGGIIGGFGGGWVGGIVYFGIDTFYPGGFTGALEFNARLQEENRKILGPNFNLYRDY